MQIQLQELASAFKSPTSKQKESYGRFAHTLAAASFIGSVTIMFTETQASFYAVARISALIVWGVVLFATGALLSKGE